MLQRTVPLCQLCTYVNNSLVSTGSFDVWFGASRSCAMPAPCDALIVRAGRTKPTTFSSRMLPRLLAWLCISATVVVVTSCRLNTFPAVSVEDYYKDVQDLEHHTTGSSLRQTLNRILSSQHLYHSYNCVWNLLEDVDSNSDGSKVLALYSRRWIDKNRRDGKVRGDADAWNREHIWAKSHGFPRKNQYAHTDIHHLRPGKAAQSFSEKLANWWG